jgi:hypothetical protein
MATFEFQGSGGLTMSGELRFQMIRHYARPWLEDAKRENRLRGRDARRREIIFAVGFAESYLFEWVRDEVLGDRFPERLDEFFPAGGRRGVRRKYADVPRALVDAQLLPELPETGDVDSQDWVKLVEYRDALVHATASSQKATWV